MFLGGNGAGEDDALGSSYTCSYVCEVLVCVVNLFDDASGVMCACGEVEKVVG